MKQNKYAMTLVELMIVVGILGLLIAIGVPGYKRARDKARKDTCINNLRMIENAADQYRINQNLTIGQVTKINWLWPSSSTAKDISSYINKQLHCAAAGWGSYKGGNNNGTLRNDLNIEANAVPHCTTDGANNYTGVSGSTDLEHSIND